MTRRVVITGMGGLSPIGNCWQTIRGALQAGTSGVCFYPDWDQVEGLQTRLGAPADFERPPHFDRKKIRTMGRVALLAARATELALADAGLLQQAADLDCGIAYGSTSGAPPSIQKYAEQITVNKTLAGVSVSDYIKFMSHTTAANLTQFFGFKGRVVPACSACSSGSQAIGFAYENIKYGQQNVMIAGGAEELHVLSATVFDIMYATSTRNHEPSSTPRPFDADRDGLVVGEGAATFVLESLEHAQARDAPIHGEILGFGTNCDGAHIVTPSVKGMRGAMTLALKDAGLGPAQIGFVNAHGTATEVGDIAESQATAQVFDRPVPISSLKSYMGHTLGACGALEAWISVAMMKEGWLAPTLNLETVDPRCAPLDYLTAVRDSAPDRIMTNNFAFGGVNTSLILGKWTG